MKYSPPWFDEDLRSAMQNHRSATRDEQAYFVYQLDRLKAHLENLQKQEVVKLWFAVKANPLSKVIQTLDKEGFCFDVASRGELAQVVAQGISPERILNTGPAKSKKQLSAFLAQGVTTFVVESLNQLKWLNEAAVEQSIKPQVLLRVQLQWPEGDKNPLGGNSLTPFGLSVKEWQGVHVEQYPALDLCGLHIFQWGNMLSNEKMFSLWSQMIEPLTTLANDIGMTLKVLDLGGG
jgi:diaminopimelate decarboxylase